MCIMHGRGSLHMVCFAILGIRACDNSGKSANISGQNLSTLISWKILPVIRISTYRALFLFVSFQFYQPQRSFTREEIASIVKDTIRTIGWYIFLEGFLHFVYATAFTQEPRIFTSLSKWALCGVMYSMLQIFLLKYKVFYLGAGLFARMDGVAVPLPPRCVSTLYLFTDMWK